MTLTEKRIGEIALAFVKNIMEHDVFIKDQKLTDSVAEAAVQEVLSKTPLIKGADITHDEFLQFFLLVTPEDKKETIQRAILKLTKK
jgi:hypothetical protein